MGLFDFFARTDINAGVEAYRSTPGAVLLDVRTEEEYREGHIPGSTHLPLQDIDRVTEILPDRETPVFVYCLSGARSAQAAAAMGRMGYRAVRSIGGIRGYRGQTEKD